MREIDLAAKVAIKRDNRRTYKIGAVAIRADGAIVCSRNENVPVPTPEAHAEVRLMKKAGWGSIVYVARVTIDGNYAMAKPCPRCQACLRAHGVKCVFYTTGSGIEKMRL